MALEQKSPEATRSGGEARRRRGGLVLWWFATDARRQSGPDRFLPSSLAFPGVSHREQRVRRLLRRLLLFLAVSAAGAVSASASGSGSGSGSSSAGMKDAGGEVELDKRSKPGHGPQEVMLLPADPGKELCKSYHLAGLVGGVWRAWTQTREATPPLEAAGGVLALAITAVQVPVPVPVPVPAPRRGGH